MEANEWSWLSPDFEHLGFEEEDASFESEVQMTKSANYDV